MLRLRNVEFGFDLSGFQAVIPICLQARSGLDPDVDRVDEQHSSTEVRHVYIERLPPCNCQRTGSD